MIAIDTLRGKRARAVWLRCLMFVGFAVFAHGQTALPESSAPAFDLGRPPTQYNVLSWDMESGLPQNTVRAILQTRDGHIWVGTSEGLARFNGTEFTVFNRANTPGFPNASITALLESPDGGLWIATDGSGVARMRDGSITRYSAGNGLLSTRVFALALGLDGSIWIGTSSGVNRFKDGKFSTFTEAEGLVRNAVRTLRVARSGELWVGTSRGLSVIKDDHVTTDATVEEFSSQDMRLLFEDGAGARWIVTNSELAHQHDGILARFTSKDGIAPQNVASIVEDRSGTLWFGSSDGLFRFERGRFVAEPLKGASAGESIRAIYEDRESNLWLGTNDGMKRIRRTTFTAFGVDGGLSHNAAASVCQDTGGAYWVGTMGGGLNWLSGRSRKVYTKKDGLLSDGIRALHPGRDGGVWVGFDRSGVVRIKDGQTTRHTSVEVFDGSIAQALHEDGHGTLWIATRKGLCSLKNGNLVNHTKSGELAADNIRAFAEDAQGGLWIGTSTGLVHHRDGRFSPLGMEHRLSSNSIRSLHADREGVLWIGTNTGGLNWMKAGRLSACTTKQGLFSDTILDIVDDDRGYLWIASRQGVFRTAKQELHDVGSGVRARVECIAFSKADGIPGVEASSVAKPAAWKSPDGRLWFATVKALITVDPARLVMNEFPPPVVITRLRVDGAEVSLNQLNHLPPGHGELEFAYAALSYVQPERIRFKYKLEGVNRDWVAAGTRQVANFSGVPPGRRRFLVQAMNSHGVWNVTGASFEFFLAPRFYQTWWFYAGLTVFAGSGAYGVYSLRVRSLRAREKQLVVLVQERTAHLKLEIDERKQAEVEVKKAQRELLNLSHQAGMAEVATGVLHNVGNVLNSVNVSATLVADRVHHSQAANIAKLAALFVEHKPDLASFLTSDPRGLLLPDYLGTLAESIAAEQTAQTTELEHLRKNVEHIKDIVAMQQAYASTSGAVETVAVTDMIEDALRINAASLERHNVTTSRDYQVRPVVTTDRRKVMQILINLVRNAKDACEESGRTDQRLTVRTTSDERGVKIAISDNGVGIPAENLLRIFNHGFTTRKDGHGFGLHSGALAARELGGSLSVESDGPGHGATFTLELPVHLLAA